MENLFSQIGGTIFSLGLLLPAALFLFQASFAKLLDKKMELFKQQLGQDSKIKELTLRSQIDFKERQLGEFYGPIYAMLKRGEPIYRLWTQGKLDEIDSEIAVLFREQNDIIARIILGKSHLIDGETIPETFTSFLTHVAVWHGFEKTIHKGVPLTELEFPEAYYPENFETEIFRVTEHLKRDLYALHRHSGLLAMPSP